MKKALLFAVCSILVCGTADAQGTAEKGNAGKEQLPPPPWVVTEMPALSQWTVEYSYTDTLKPGETSNKLAGLKQLAAQDPQFAKAMSDPSFVAALDPPRPKQLIVVKTNNVRHEVKVLERDVKGERWCINDTAVERVPGSAKLNAYFGVKSGNEFAEFGWISQANFVGMKKHLGQEGLVFQQEMSPSQLINPGNFTPAEDDVKVMVTALTNPETKMPILLQFGVETRVYKVYPPPSGVLTMPEEFSAAAKEAQARISAATKPLSRP